MKRLLFALALSAACAAPAFAQTSNVGTTECIVTVTRVCVVSGGGKVVKVKNRSASAQTATLSCTSGGVAVEEVPALAAGQEVHYADGYYSGDPFAADLTCTVTGTILFANSGDGIVIYTAPR